MSHSVDFYFDLSSPYSYLASTQIGAMAERHGVTVNYRPMVITAVFKAAQIAIPASSPTKAKYMVQDCQRWAAHYGVPFVWSQYFPCNTIKAQRAICAAGANAGKLTSALFDALWAEDRNIADAAVIAQILVELELDSSIVMAASETQPVKDQLRAYTDEAIARGVFGAPSFMIGNDLFFGNDRLEFVEAALTAA